MLAFYHLKKHIRDKSHNNNNRHKLPAAVAVEGGAAQQHRMAVEPPVVAAVVLPPRTLVEAGAKQQLVEAGAKQQQQPLPLNRQLVQRPPNPKRRSPWVLPLAPHNGCY